MASDRGGNQAEREARGERNRARGLFYYPLLTFV
jgi:hypothetical protein